MQPSAGLGCLPPRMERARKAAGSAAETLGRKEALLLPLSWRSSFLLLRLRVCMVEGDAKGISPQGQGEMGGAKYMVRMPLMAAMIMACCTKSRPGFEIGT